MGRLTPGHDGRWLIIAAYVKGRSPKVGNEGVAGLLSAPPGGVIPAWGLLMSARTIRENTAVTTTRLIYIRVSRRDERFARFTLQ